PGGRPPHRRPPRRRSRPLGQRLGGGRGARAGGLGSMSALLECRGLDVAYGQVQVLFDVDFSVDEGEIVALLGTNGAGKSTLLKAAAGLVRPVKGSVTFEGDDITGHSADAVARSGVALMPGGKSVFPTLSVAGVTVVLVEQSVNLALNLAKRAVFMEKGEVRFEGPTAELLDRPDILRSVFIAGASGKSRSSDGRGRHNAHQRHQNGEGDAAV